MLEVKENTRTIVSYTITVTGDEVTVTQFKNEVGRIISTVNKSAVANDNFVNAEIQPTSVEKSTVGMIATKEVEKGHTGENNVLNSAVGESDTPKPRKRKTEKVQLTPDCFTTVSAVRSAEVLTDKPLEEMTAQELNRYRMKLVQGWQSNKDTNDALLKFIDSKGIKMTAGINTLELIKQAINYIHNEVQAKGADE